MKAIHLIAMTAFAMTAAVPMIVHGQTAAPAAAKGAWSAEGADDHAPRRGRARRGRRQSLRARRQHQRHLGPAQRGIRYRHRKWRGPLSDAARARPHGVAVVNGKIITVGGFVATVHKDGQPSCSNMTRPTMPGARSPR